MNIKSKVMTIANALVKQGVKRSAAMVRAWITVKLRAIQTRAAGVTHGNRQTLLNHLTRYKPEDITVQLRREQTNAHDSNAIQIVAAVRNKGAAVIGYINRELAAALNVRAAACFIWSCHLFLREHIRVYPLLGIEVARRFLRERRKKRSLCGVIVLSHVPRTTSFAVAYMRSNPLPSKSPTHLFYTLSALYHPFLLFHYITYIHTFQAYKLHKEYTRILCVLTIDKHTQKVYNIIKLKRANKLKGSIIINRIRKALATANCKGLYKAVAWCNTLITRILYHVSPGLSSIF